ncbi:hypothetical protein ASE75_03490 [Sphingomonas sp. Leaf17]|nr:hypothetical protein ASE75_03490 [Sphingomonas sp. Leaf17]
MVATTSVGARNTDQPTSDTADTAPISVMIVGMFHFGNPGRDVANLTVDDVLAPNRQAEIATVATSLERFRPTRVGVEWPAAKATRDYAAYHAGTLPPSRDEVTQLAFRVAKARGIAQVDGLDVAVGLPFGPAMAYAKDHGQTALIDQITKFGNAAVAAQAHALATRGIAAVLRLLNDPVNGNGHHLYRELLKAGDGDTQPGVDVFVAWQRRNALTCAKLLQTARPGDRMMVFYGAGHLPLLRQCVAETPGYVLVDTMAYLPPR